MKMKKFGLKDQLHITVRDKYGRVKKDYTLTYGLLDRFLCWLGLRHHSITYKGMFATAYLLIDKENASDFKYMDIGTGTNPANPSQTALQSSVLTSRKLAVTSLVKTDVNSTDNETAQWVYTFSKANCSELSGTQTITEVGIFSAATGGLMLMRIVWAGDTCNWDNGDTLQLTIKCQVKQGS